MEWAIHIKTGDDRGELIIPLLFTGGETRIEAIERFKDAMAVAGQSLGIRFPIEDMRPR